MIEKANDLIAPINQFIANHPLYSQAISMVIGAVSSKAIPFLKTKGVDDAVANLRSGLKSFGLDDTRISEIENGLSAAAQRAADDLKKDSQPKP